MLEYVCAIGVIIIGLVFLMMMGLFIYYFNKLLNHIFYLEGLKFEPYEIEELPDSISFDGLEEFVKEK